MSTETDPAQTRIDANTAVGRAERRVIDAADDIRIATTRVLATPNDEERVDDALAVIEHQLAELNRRVALLRNAKAEQARVHAS